MKMPRISADAWRPAGIEDLEPSAWEALRATRSALVIAGPGAGKTEFLAQRAAYLLQTSTCPPPRKILAISFKRDAAANLARRVSIRCGPEDAARFVSVTFDAFAKSLLDRFAVSLPAQWRPTKPYDIFFAGQRDYQEFLQHLLVDCPGQWAEDVVQAVTQDFESKVIGGQRLPPDRIVPRSGEELAVSRWWEDRLQARSSLTFTCINRLAELAVRLTPQLQLALSWTYPFVFVDEFQDTTYAQYDFLKALFLGHDIQVTAVGDQKQRIMAWAGAKPDVFAEFEADFQARSISLTLNHRSSPALVQIQFVIARAIDPQSTVLESRAATDVQGDAAEIWLFPSSGREAEQIARWIRQDMDERLTSPRDYGILVRQRASTFEAQLTGEFTRAGIRLRNESRALGRTTLQDLLAEDVTRLGVAILRLAAEQRAPDAWALSSQALGSLRAVHPDDDDLRRKAHDSLGTFVRSLRQLTGEDPGETVDEIIRRLFEFLDFESIKRAYPEYADGDSLEIAVEAFRLHMQTSAGASRTWIECLNEFEGIDAVPLMTVHKSKGLEYDTMLFMGLDDDSWWSHRAGNIEGLSTFFVALSRAKQRAIFTYCEGRGRERVADLYDLLREAHVAEVRFV